VAARAEMVRARTSAGRDNSLRRLMPGLYDWVRGGQIQL
jgi:hypothetical protein